MYGQEGKRTLSESCSSHTLFSDVHGIDTKRHDCTLTCSLPVTIGDLQYIARAQVEC